MTKKHDACPLTVGKHDQGTGNRQCALQREKATAHTAGGTKNHKPKNQIWSRTEYDASPYLDSIITSFDPKRNNRAARLINLMHNLFVCLITDHLSDHGIPFAAISGETFTLTIRFASEVPEDA
ncbi:hypothetical protein SDC9_45727 [bioreactor metagenome]|uniref:Uncharacterized protein n=1 Tax=bioreactor metagenome TaxID=1076179 RepID=A0A644W6X5_9ZZZZ